MLTLQLHLKIDLTCTGNIYYIDNKNSTDDEYLSCGIDRLPVLAGRTAVQVYTDFMADFEKTMGDLMPDTIDEIQVGEL